MIDSSGIAPIPHQTALNHAQTRSECTKSTFVEGMAILPLTLWLACYTQEEIAEAVGWERQTITDWIKDFADFGHMSESGITLANHADEKFERPIYNIWKQQEKTPGT